MFFLAVFIVGFLVHLVSPRSANFLAGLLTFCVVVPIVVVSTGSVAWGITGAMGLGLSWPLCCLVFGGPMAYLIGKAVYS